MPSTPADTHAASTKTDRSVDAIVEFFETLSPASLASIGIIYAANARFKDPFSEVQGLPAISRVYQHMFESLHAPHFVVTGRVLQGSECFLTWNFIFRFQKIQPAQEQTVRGCSHLVLDAQGRIAVHRDYWDVAEELYEKIPGLGALMRWLKKRAST